MEPSSVTTPSVFKSTSSIITNEPTFTNGSLVIVNVAFKVPLNLSDSNYFTWKSQSDVVLIGFDIYGSLRCASSSDDSLFWIRQDKLILRVILASISCASSKISLEAWNTMANMFARPFRSQLMHLHERLMKEEGSHSIQDYLSDVKNNATNEFALLGSPSDADETTLYVINGLSLDFIDISAAFRTGDQSISLSELYEQHDAYLKWFENRLDDFPIRAYAANRVFPPGLVIVGS